MLNVLAQQAKHGPKEGNFRKAFSSPCSEKSQSSTPVPIKLAFQTWRAMAEALLGSLLPLAHGQSIGSSDLRQAQQFFRNIRTRRRIAPETRCGIYLPQSQRASNFFQIYVEGFSFASELRPGMLVIHAKHMYRWHVRYETRLRASSSSEATNLPLTDLQIMLEDAIRQENYQEAARLRDVLT